MMMLIFSNVFVSLFSVFEFLSFKENKYQGTPFSCYFQIIKYGKQYLKKAWFTARMERVLWAKWNITSWFMTPVEKTWFYGKKFFEVVIVMVKDKQMQYKRYNVNKISFMRYMIWTRVMLQKLLRNLKWFIYFFLLLFSFHYHCHCVKGQL